MKRRLAAFLICGLVATGVGLQAATPDTDLISLKTEMLALKSGVTHDIGLQMAPAGGGAAVRVPMDNSSRRTTNMQLFRTTPAGVHLMGQGVPEPAPFAVAGRVTAAAEAPLAAELVASVIEATWGRFDAALARLCAVAAQTAAAAVAPETHDRGDGGDLSEGEVLPQDALELSMLDPGWTF